jgi:hypothetical protein
VAAVFTAGCAAEATSGPLYGGTLAVVVSPSGLGGAHAGWPLRVPCGFWILATPDNSPGAIRRSLLAAETVVVDEGRPTEECAAVRCGTISKSVQQGHLCSSALYRITFCRTLGPDKECLGVHGSKNVGGERL